MISSWRKEVKRGTKSKKKRKENKQKRAAEEGTRYMGVSELDYQRRLPRIQFRPDRPTFADRFTAKKVMMKLVVLFSFSLLMF
jgi:hypothetical protein